MTLNPPRANRLDTLRGLAIILVFVYDFCLFVGAEPNLGWPSVVGWAGVDLFFVLSGHLIANPLVAGLARGGLEGYYPNVHCATLCRFDEFLPGVAAALLKNLHPRIWQRLARRGQALWWAGLLAITLVLLGVFHGYVIDDYGHGGFMSVFGYSRVAMAFGVLVMAALTPTSWLHAARIRGASAVAAGSYRSTWRTRRCSSWSGAMRNGRCGRLQSHWPPLQPLRCTSESCCVVSWSAPQ
jgi:hypothetical protein